MVKPLTDGFLITGFLLANLVAGMIGWCMDQTNVQRVQGAPSSQDGQRGAIFSGFLKLAIPFILVPPALFFALDTRGVVNCWSRAGGH
jgi:SSS family solute:Na+ symporter